MINKYGIFIRKFSCSGIRFEGFDSAAKRAKAIYLAAAKARALGGKKGLEANRLENLAKYWENEARKFVPDFSVVLPEINLVRRSELVSLAESYDVDVGEINLEKKLAHMNISIDELVYYVEEMKQLGYSGKLPVTDVLEYIWEAKKDLRIWEAKQVQIDIRNKDEVINNFTVAEIQQFIKNTSAVKHFPWRSHIFPSILSEEFLQKITEHIKNIKDNYAYSVLFIAQTTELDTRRFASLGHSVTITNKTDPKELYERLLANHKFIQESSNGVFDERIVAKSKFIGKTGSIAHAIKLARMGVSSSRDALLTPSPLIALGVPLVNWWYIFNEFRKYQDMKKLDKYSPLGLADQLYEMNQKIWAKYIDIKGWTLVEYASKVLVINSEEFGSITVFNMKDHMLVRLVNQLGVIEIKDHIVREDRITREYAHATIQFKPAMMGREAVITNFIPTTGHRKFSTRVNNKPVSMSRTVVADLEALVTSKGQNIPIMISYLTYRNGKEICEVYNYDDYYQDPESMIVKFWADLISQFPNSNVYFHNWAGYDAFHTLNGLVLAAQMHDCYLVPFVKNSKIIEIKLVNRKTKKVILTVKDSFLILPMSLAKLAKSFNVETKKGHFPHYFNPLEHGLDNLNYIGPIPEYKYFEAQRTNQLEYAELKAKYQDNWSFVQEMTSYLKDDVRALYQVLEKFFLGIHETMDINVTNASTMPSVALKSWKETFKHLDSKPDIFSLNKQTSQLIRESYLGAIVDVYKPRLQGVGYYYDVNSLYPHSMLNFMPVGLPSFQMLTVHEFLNTNWFGFLKCTVICPDNKYIPILPIKLDGKIVCPTGQFTGCWFSEEIRFAISEGYELVSISYGIEFSKNKQVFNEYIKYLNDVKEQASIEGNIGKRTISKLLMNSLYGRFGLKDIETTSLICSPNESQLIARNFPIKRSIQFSNGYELIEYYPLECYNNDAKIEKYIYDPMTAERNVSIAAAITSYSRITINKIKLECLNQGIDVYYSDTDSIVTNKEIAAEYVDNKKLGKLKLEHVLSDGYFISPKLYQITTSEGKVKNVSRGYGGEFTQGDMETLYQGQTVEKTKTKWQRDWANHTIYFEWDKKLNLSGEYNKRIKVYDEEGKWVNTKPIHLQEEACKPVYEIYPKRSLSDYTPQELKYILENLSLNSIIKKKVAKRSKKSNKHP
jgi:hypothetical protein